MLEAACGRHSAVTKRWKVPEAYRPGRRRVASGECANTELPHLLH